jgi:predicted nuclease of predicted toxin-antitoxin system
MRVLLDEHINRRHIKDFGNDIDVTTVEYQGWKGKKNGELLNLAAQEFDVLVTMDKSIEHQQNWRRLNLSIIVISAKTNRYQDVAPFIPQVIVALPELRPGQLVHIP